MDVYTLAIHLLSTDEDSPWKRVVEFTEDTTLIDLHEFIQDTIEFDDDHLFEFFTGRSETNRDRVFSDDEDAFLDEEAESLETTLKEIYPLNRKKLFYLFDYGDSWLFEIRRVNTRKQVEPGVEYPRIIEEVGENPDQYPDPDDEDWDDD